MDSTQRKTSEEAHACQHCGALVYSDSRKCSQCGKFPVLLRRCPRCGCISAGDAERCWKCERVFEPGGDYL
jgi:hypothetical protein